MSRVGRYDRPFTDDEVTELEKLIVELHNQKRTDIYSLRSQHDPAGYARSQRKQKIPEAIRWIVWRRDNFTCVYCYEDEASLTLDHVIPETEGGTYDPGNLVTACGSCNNRKADQSREEFEKTEWLLKKQAQNVRRRLNRQVSFQPTCDPQASVKTTGRLISLTTKVQKQQETKPSAISKT